MTTADSRTGPEKESTKEYRVQVVCQLSRMLKDGLEFVRLRWSAGSGYFEPYEIETAKLKGCVQQVRRSIQEIVLFLERNPHGLQNPAGMFGDVSPNSLNALVVELAKAGRSLFDTLIPGKLAGDVKEWLETLAANGLVDTVEIQIDGDSPEELPLAAIPWTLLFDGKVIDPNPLRNRLDKGETGDYGHFWGAKFDISCGKNVNPLRTARPIDLDKACLVIMADPKVIDPLTADVPDRQEFEDLLDQIDALRPADSPNGPIVYRMHSYQELLEFIEARNTTPDVLYWLSHASENALEIPREAGADPEPVKIEELTTTFSQVEDRDRSKRLLAFFNGCRTAAAEEHRGFYETFARDFAFFDGLIATECETLDVFAHKFGMAFLEAFFIDRVPLGRIMHSLRRSSLPLGLLYGTYSPPGVRMIDAADKKAARPKRTFALAKDLGDSLRVLSAATLPLPAQVEAPARKRRVDQAKTLAWPEKPYPSLGYYTLADQALFLGRDDDSARLAEMVDSPELRLLLLHGTSGSGKSSVIRAGLVPYLENQAVGYRFPRRPKTEGLGETEDLHLFFRPSDDFSARLAADLLEFTKQAYSLDPRPDGTPQEPVDLRPILAGCIRSTSKRPEESGTGENSIPRIAPTRKHPASTPKSGMDSAPAHEHPDSQPKWGTGSGAKHSAAEVPVPHFAPADPRKSATETSVPVSSNEFDLSLAELKSSLDDPKRPELLREILDALTAAIPENLVVVVDQAEELYTLAQGDTPAAIDRAEARRRQAFALLRGCLRGSGRWKVILSYRTEYHGRITDGIRHGLKKTPGLADYLITDLNRAQLTQVIEHPTLDFPVVEGLCPPREKYGFVYEKGVVDLIVKEIFELRGRNTDSVLPIAQVVCAQLFEEARTKGTNGAGLYEITHAMLSQVRSDSALPEPRPNAETPGKSGGKAKSKAESGEKADASGPVLNILEKYAEKTLAEVAATGRQSQLEKLSATLARLAPNVENSLKNVFSTRIQSLKRLMMALYHRQPDGSLTTDQISRRKARQDFWKGSNEEFEDALKVASRARLLRVESATGADEAEESTIRLGHDTLGAVANRWAIAVRRRKLRNTLLIRATAACVALSCLGCILWLNNRELAKANTLAVRESARADKAADGMRKERDSANLARADAIKQMQMANAYAADSTLILATNLFDGGNDLQASEKLDSIPANQRHFPWGLLNRQIYSRFLPLTGHQDSVMSVSFSPDGQTLASGSYDNTIRLWNVTTGVQQSSPLAGHKKWVTSVAFSPDGKTLASGSYDNTIRLWNVATGEAKGSPLTGHTDSVFSVAFSVDGRTLASGSDDKTIRLWDVATGVSKGSPLAGHTDSVFSVAFSVDGKTLASGSDDKTIRLWEVAKGVAKGSPLNGHVGPVYSVAFSPDGKTLASGSYDGTIRLWDAATGEAKGTPMTGHTNAIWSVAFASDGKTLASGCSDHTIGVWVVATGGHECFALAGHQKLNSVAFSTDGNTLASGSADKTIRLWDVATREAKGAPLAGHKTAVASMAFSSDGKTLASGSTDKTIRLWNIATGIAQGSPMEGHTETVISLSFSPDGRTLASGSHDNTIRLWDVATGAARGKPLAGHTDSVSSVAFSPDGKTLASGSDDKTIRLWDVSTGVSKGRPLAGHTNWVTSVSFSPDSRTLASGSSDNTIRLWDVSTGEPKGLPLAGHAQTVTSVSFSPVGKTLASGSDDKTIRLWNLATGTEVRTIPFDNLIGSVCFVPSDKSGSARRNSLAAEIGDEVYVFDSEIDEADTARIRDERIARNFLRFYPLYDEAIAAIRRNETLTDEEKDRIAAIIQPLIEFARARAAANAIPLPDDVFQP